MSFPELAGPTLDPQSPWPGLQAFTLRDKAFFFGRHDELDELARLVRREILTVLFGRSGLGKTSLLQAGLFPLLCEKQFLPIPLRLDFSPGAGSLASQVKALVREALRTQPVEAPEPSDTETLWEFFHRAQIWNEKNRLLTPLLVFDQFEEIFTLGRSDDRVNQLLVELGDLIENRIPSPVRDRLEQSEVEDLPFSYNRQTFRVILSLREDFLPYLEDLRSLIPTISKSYFRLNRMSGLQGLDAILKPGIMVVGESVALEILRFIGGAREERAASTPTSPKDMVVEPALLSLFCRELNTKRIALGLPQITRELVAGERESILSNFYERSVSDLPKPVRSFIEDRLLTTSGFRRGEALEDALAISGVTQESLVILVDRRLLRIERRLGTYQLELIHDVLTGVILESRALRHRKEQRRKLRRRFLSAAVLISIVTLSSVMFFVRERELKLRAVADQRRAERLIKFMLGDLPDRLSQIGRLDLLERSLNEMLLYFESLPTNDSSRDNYYRGLAYHNRGDVYLQRGWSLDALADYRKALRIFEGLYAAVPGELKVSHQIGVIQFHIAGILRQQGKLSASLGLLKDSLRTLQSTMARKPRDAKFQEPFQACYTELGKTSLRLGRSDEGKTYLLDAARVAETSAAQAPNDLAKQLNLADSYILLGNAELSDGEIQTAEKDFSKAADLLDLIRRSDSDARSLGVKKEEAALKLGRGSLFLAEGKAADALAAYDEALQFQREVLILTDSSASLAKAAMLEIRIALLQAALAEGNLALAATAYSDALERANRLTKNNPDNSEWRYSLAAVTSLAGELKAAQGHPELAVASYQQAIEILDDLAKKSPEDISLQRALAWNHYLKGLADRNPASASREWTRAHTLIETVAVSSKVHDADVQDVHARVLIALGQPERARPICADLSGKGWNWHGFQSLCRSAEGRPGGTKLAALR